mgnify:CR=1 FL=1
MENIEKLLNAIVADYARYSKDVDRVKTFSEDIQLLKGKKYYKIVRASGGVWGFIQIKNDNKFKAGDILKAAGWATPARNFARGNVIEENFQNVRWTGA